jgi:hypothetical protein
MTGVRALNPEYEGRYSIQGSYLQIINAEVAAQLILKVPRGSSRSIDRRLWQICNARISDVEEVGIPAAVRVDEEVAKAVLIWTGRADQIVQVAGKRDAFAGRGVDVDAVTLKVTVVAKIAIIQRSASVTRVCIWFIDVTHTLVVARLLMVISIAGAARTTVAESAARAVVSFIVSW